jgi:putative transcriptional regulator
MSSQSSIREMLAKRIAGEIVLSNDPGQVMRKWRSLIDATQVEIAQELDLSPSVISDYETGRRRSPGSQFIKRYVEALLEIDHRRGGEYTKQLARITLDPSDIFIDLREFTVPITARRLIDEIEGDILFGEELMNRKVFGYTIVDSLKAIQLLSGLEFYRIFGATSERALIFTGVSKGRSPMIALKISPFKPRIVVLHGLEGQIDPLAIKLASNESIPLCVSRLEDEEALVNALIKLNRKR